MISCSIFSCWFFSSGFAARRKSRPISATVMPELLSSTIDMISSVMEEEAEAERSRLLKMDSAMGTKEEMSNRRRQMISAVLMFMLDTTRAAPFSALPKYSFTQRE